MKKSTLLLPPYQQAHIVFSEESPVIIKSSSIVPQNFEGESKLFVIFEGEREEIALLSLDKREQELDVKLQNASVIVNEGNSEIRIIFEFPEYPPSIDLQQSRESLLFDEGKFIREIETSLSSKTPLFSLFDLSERTFNNNYFANELAQPSALARSLFLIALRRIPRDSISVQIKEIIDVWDTKFADSQPLSVGFVMLFKLLFIVFRQEMEIVSSYIMGKRFSLVFASLFDPYQTQELISHFSIKNEQYPTACLEKILSIVLENNVKINEELTYQLKRILTENAFNELLIDASSIQRLELELNQTKNKNEGLQNQIEQTNVEMATLQKNMNKLEADLKASNEDNEKKNRELATAKEENEKLKLEINDKETKLQEETEKCQNFMKDVASKDEEIKKLRNMLQKQKAEMEKKIQEAENATAEIKKTLEAKLKQTLELSKKEKEELEKNIQTQQKEIEDKKKIEKNCQNMQSKLRDLEAKLLSSDKEKEALKEDNKKISINSSKIHEAEKRIVELKAELKKAEEAKSEIEAKMKNGNEENETLRKENEKYQNRINEIRNEFSSFKSKELQRAKALEDKLSNMKTVLNENKDLRTRLEELEKLLKEANEDNEEDYSEEIIEEEEEIEDDETVDTVHNLNATLSAIIFVIVSILSFNKN